MRFLFTTFEGGGHVPPAIMVAARLAAGGDAVLFVSDEANRAAAEAAGLSFSPWRTAPNRLAQGCADDPLDDWKRRWPPAVVKALVDAVMCGPARAYAADTSAYIRQFQPDAVVSNELLLGVLAAAEAAGTPLALLTANVWCYPTRPDTPPFGPGFGPARNAFERGRERTTRRLIAGLYDYGLADLNAARGEMNLPPLEATLGQLDYAKLVLLGASQAFDFGVEPPPRPFAYAGPLVSVPSWVERRDIVAADAAAPLVLVSFSTTFQDQAPVVRRCIRALAGTPVRGVVTLGPAISPEMVDAPPNVQVVQSASHDDLVPRCAAVICHGGHGTALRPLMNGVPVICLPMGRDQPENAARIAARGAGIRLSRHASAAAIRRALRRVIGDGRFAAAARALGDQIRLEADGGARAAAVLRRTFSAAR